MKLTKTVRKDLWNSMEREMRYGGCVYGQFFFYFQINGR